MKKEAIVVMVLAIFIMTISACGNDKVIDGKLYETYGLLNKDEVKDSNIRYKIIVGNVIWSIITVETVVLPAYFVLFSIYEPVGKAEGTESQ